MKTTFYYFTGTGNSLYGAEKIAKNFDETEIIPIARVLKSKEEIKFPKGVSGIVCPVYLAGIPLIVSEFIKKADLSLPDYIFIVLTYGAYTASAEKSAYDIMEKAGRAPDYVTKVKMADNYLPIFTPPTGEKLNAIMKSAEAEFNRVAEEISDQKKKVPGSNIVNTLIGNFMHADLIKTGHEKDRHFYAEDSCNGCGTCEKVCPVGNITIENQKPVWHHNCEFCFACVHLCPRHAIQYKNSTKNKARYKNPEIDLKDLMRTW